MLYKIKLILINSIAGLLLLFSIGLVVAENSITLASNPANTIWAIQDSSGNIEIQLYFFWSTNCPHCSKAKPVVEKMSEKLTWLKLHSLPVSQPENRSLFIDMAAKLGDTAKSVPTFFLCGLMLSGFDEHISPVQLEKILYSCQKNYQSQSIAKPTIETKNQINLPGIGIIGAQSLSLPILTLVLAGLDSFNPCAFFVLLFLLSLLVHAQNRKKMMLIGGIYIVISGIIYFLFMSAWLNLFMFIGDARWITLLAGLIAIIIAIINIKDFFWFHQGVSLSIPESAKPGLFQRMRGLLNANKLGTMIFGTVVLAVVANSYELLCTAGFPMVYTRTLTLHQLPVSSYYFYLILYNIIYVVPLFIITITFILTLGSRKLKEHEGRALKLMSGSMMLGLGILLVISPGLLNNILVAIGLLLFSILITIVLMRINQK